MPAPTQRPNAALGAGSKLAVVVWMGVGGHVVVELALRSTFVCALMFALYIRCISVSLSITRDLETHSRIRDLRLGVHTEP